MKERKPSRPSNPKAKKAKTDPVSDTIAVHCAHVKMVDVTDLKPNPRNPNQHGDIQVALLAKNIRALGWRHPIIVSTRSGFIVAGHARLAAANMLGCSTVPVDHQDFDTDADEMAYLIADNRIAELAEIDNAMIKDLLQELDTGEIDTDLTGFTPDALEELMLQAPPEIEEDDVPELQEKAVTDLGRMYQLGAHRLMCGDSTSEQDVARLMCGEKADMVFADPPYGISHSGKGITANGVEGNDFGEIMGDKDVSIAIKAFGLCCSVFPEAVHIFWGANYYPSTLPNGHGWIVWDKQRVGDTFSGAELAFVNGGVRVDVFRHMWHGMVKASERGQKRVHPTQKPIALAQWCFENHGKPATVVDLFGGSGSTLIACEQTNRACRMMELDPRYCDVIVRRYAKLVGANADAIFESGTDA